MVPSVGSSKCLLRTEHERKKKEVFKSRGDSLAEEPEVDLAAAWQQ